MLVIWSIYCWLNLADRIRHFFNFISTSTCRYCSYPLHFYFDGKSLTLHKSGCSISVTLHNINQCWIIFTACDSLMLDLYNGLGFSLWRVLLGICDRRLCKMYTYYFFAGEYPPHPRKMINFCSASKSWINMPWNFGTILVISTRIYHWGNPPQISATNLGGWVLA